MSSRGPEAGETTTPHLVLVGAGHAHVEVLRDFASNPPRPGRRTLVVDRLDSWYSGMVPGVLAGRYAPDEAVIQVGPLARAAGFEVLVDPGSGWSDAHTLTLKSGARVRYDLISINVGSTTATPGALARTDGTVRVVPVRPIARLLETLLTAPPQTAVTVLGGGAGGVELAFAVRARLGSSATVHLVEAGDRLMPARQARVSHALTREAERLRIEVHLGATAERIAGGALHLSTGRRLQTDTLIVATGAAAPGWLAGGPWPTDDDGFLLVEDTLQIAGHANAFAGGDCMALKSHPGAARAGVHAVRQGPVLAHNLSASLAVWPEEPSARRAETRALREYDRQADFLTLLNLGDGRALATKWGLSWTSRSMMWLKDWIDRRWLARYTAPALS